MRSVGLALIIPAILASSSVAGLTSTSAFATIKVEELSPGVYAVLNQSPLGLANHSNSVFVVNDKDVILVDTQFTLERTQTVLETIQRITTKPVSVLVNTHWHDDHTFGNQMVVKAFPKVQIVASSQTQQDMLGIGVENRKQQIAGIRGAIETFLSCINNYTTIDGNTMSDDERAAYKSTVAIATEYESDQRYFKLTSPVVTFDDRLVLKRHKPVKRGKRTIEVLYVGPAVTAGDAIVYLPDAGILVAGDVVDNPLPFAYRCNVGGWIAALKAIKELNPRIIVPGHGEVMHDMRGVDRLHAVLVSIRDQTNAAVAKGDSLQAVQASVKVDDLRASIVGSNKMLAFLFDGYFLAPAVRSAYDEARSH